MPLPFILGGLAIAAAGYGVKKGLDAKNANDEAKDLFKKAEELLGEKRRGLSLLSLVARMLLQGLMKRSSMS